MDPRPSWSCPLSSVLLAAAAWAGSCCAAGGAVPEVLGPDETIGAGVALSGGPTLASFTWDGRVAPAGRPSGRAEAAIVGLGRVSSGVQLGLRVPVEAAWVADGKSGIQASPGDMEVGARWDAAPVHCGEWSIGIRPALSAGIGLPTGSGAVAPSLGVTWEGSHPGGNFAASLGARWPIGSPAALSAGGVMAWQVRDLWIRGVGRLEYTPSIAPVVEPRLGAGVLWDASEHVRATIGLDSAVPVPGLGRNSPVDVALTASVLLVAPT